MDETRRYHNKIYNNKRIYSDDSWLKEAEPLVLELLDYFRNRDELNILDLCSGVGRNAIRMAELLKGTKSRITCVDVLETAIEKLKLYIRDYHVAEMIDVVQADVAEYKISGDSFDYIISWSCVEHLNMRSKFNIMLEKIKNGTRDHGINCLLINSNVTEYDVQEEVTRKALIENNFDQQNLIRLLHDAYKNWKILFIKTDHYVNHLERYGKKYIFKSQPVIIAAQKL